MNLPVLPIGLLGWSGLASVVTFGLFGYDKWRAGRGGRRLAESALWWASVLGGWPGGLLGILFFRHKSAKPMFLLKFTAAFLLWAGWVLVVARLIERR